MKNAGKKAKYKRFQKSFYFEDYVESEDITNHKNTKIIVSRRRTTFIFFIFLSLIFIFCTKATYLAFSKKVFQYSYNHKLKALKIRGDIVDQNDNILARNINSYSVGIQPKLIKNKKKFLIDLRLIYPDIKSEIISGKINKGTYFYIKKKITEEEKIKLFSLGYEAVRFEATQTRFYPQKNLFSHVIGQIDEDNYGISGLEKSFDLNLKSEKIISSYLKLTLDSNLQHIIRD